MAKKIYELNNIVIDEDGKKDKYNFKIDSMDAEHYELPLSLPKFHNVYVGRKDVDSCQDAYSEISNLNVNRV